MRYYGGDTKKLFFVVDGKPVRFENKTIPGLAVITNDLTSQDKESYQIEVKHGINTFSLSPSLLNENDFESSYNNFMEKNRESGVVLSLDEYKEILNKEFHSVYERMEKLSHEKGIYKTTECVIVF